MQNVSARPKAGRLLKSETAAQSHRFSWVTYETDAINCTKMALKLQLQRDKICTELHDKIACVNEP